MTRARRQQLIEDNMPLVRRIAARLARQYAPRAVVEDFVQDGMVGLCDAAKRCKSLATFPALAHFRIHGAIMDGYRRKSYRESLHLSLEPESPIAAACLQIPDPQPLPDELASRAELESHVRAAIAELPGDEQHVIREALRGVPVAEIAKQKGQSRQHTFRKLSIAKKAVSDKMRKVA